MTISFMERDGGRIAYEVVGEGPLVVLSHGMGDRGSAFRHLTPLLVAAGYRVATIDVRGHGDSTTGWPTYVPAEVGADLIALVRELGGGPAALVGSSSSGAGIVYAAAEAPELVSAVVQISPFAAQPEYHPVMKVVAAAVMHSPLLWNAYYGTLFPAAKPADLAAYRKTMIATLREPGRMAALRGVIAPDSTHWTDRAPEVRCPVLVMMGDRDPDFPDPAAMARQSADAFRPTAPSVTVTMIEQSGHYPYADQPAATADALVAFLRQSVHA